jgi:arginyl-tRNA synthetase
MASKTIDGLRAILEELEVGTPIPNFPDASILVRPIDIWRSYLAETTARVLDCDAALAFEAVQTARTKDDGDLTLILPKLKLKSNAKPKELAYESIKKARIDVTPGAA